MSAIQGTGGFVPGAMGIQPIAAQPAATPSTTGGGGKMPTTSPTDVGGMSDACAGAGHVAQGGGGTSSAPAGSLAAIVESLAAVVKQLGELVSKLQQGGGAAGGTVAGVQGGAAQAGQAVARNVAPVLSGGAEDDAFEKRVLELVNVERRKQGLSDVMYNPILDKAAGGHAQQMSATGTMAHDGIGDGTPGDRIRAVGFREAWGENVATGQRSPEEVVQQWMNSELHRKNIMDPNFTQMGVEMVQGADGRTYTAQEFGA